MPREAEPRSLPSVEKLSSRFSYAPHALAVSAARKVIAAARDSLLTGSGSPNDLEAEARDLIEKALRPSLRPVLNATGVIVHTNLGRAPLADSAVDAVASVARCYSNLEYDLSSARRGSRQAHVEQVLAQLSGAEAALAVNNCAAAVLLAVSSLASGREVLVSRGQLVEIGGSFRIPEVIGQSGARLVEVGTTNRTRLGDYGGALNEQTGAVLRVHPSNYRVVGFVEEVEVEDLCTLGPPVIDDAGSGVMAKLPALEDEPAVQRSVRAGCAVVCFSGDKLLGGPQAGLMVGTEDAIDTCRRNPLARALRIDKLSLAALEATLKLYLDPDRLLRTVPVLRMLTLGAGELNRRAELMRSELSAAGVEADVVDEVAKVGGGALPLLELEGPVCAVNPAPLAAGELAARARRAEPPVVGRLRGGRLLLDPRTLGDQEAALAARTVASVLP